MLTDSVLPQLLALCNDTAVSNKDDAAELLLDGMDIPLVASATGLQVATVSHIRRRLNTPVPGDPDFRGAGLLCCRLCGCPYSQHEAPVRCSAGEP